MSLEAPRSATWQAAGEQELAERAPPLQAQLVVNQAPGARPAQDTPRLEALDGPRYLASVMIVCSHFYGDQLGRFAYWGGVWTQFFFALSGFVLAYVEMVRSPKKKVNMSLSEYITKRLITVYPTYLFTVVVSMFETKKSLMAWVVFPLNVTLMQQWLPICWWQEDSYWPSRGIACAVNQWAETSWFMSALVIYWMMLRPLARCMQRRSLLQTSLIIIFCWLFSFVVGFAMASKPNGMPMLSALIMSGMQFGPLGYIHVFVCGVAAARLFILTAMRDADTCDVPNASTERMFLDKKRAPALFRYGCVAGYTLYAILVVAWPDWKESKLWYSVLHNGGVLPVMLLILLGGAAGADPIANNIFRTKPFLTLGRISYAQYLLQMNVMHLCKRDFGHRYGPAICVVALPVFAYCVEHFFTRVFTEWLRLSQKK